MARKRKKVKGRAKHKLQAELLGLLFIFLAIFGSGASAISDGLIPNWLENIFHFLFGIWYFIASILLLIIGIYLLIKRQFPKFFTKKKVGFFILFLGLLLLTHIQVFEKLLISSVDTSIVKATWHHYISFIKGEGVRSQTGGGMVGGLLFAICYYLFSAAGAKIVAVFSMIIGLIFLTNFSFNHFFTYLNKKIKPLFNKLITNTKNKRVKSKAQKKEKREQAENVVIDDDQSFTNNVDVQYSYDEETNNQPVINIQDDHKSKDQATQLTKSTEHNMLTEENANSDHYMLPAIDLLDVPASGGIQKNKSHIQQTVKTLEDTFKSFNVKANVTKVHVGPAVTRYEVYPEAGVKVSRIVNLHDDLALALAAQDIRIEAPIPGKSAVGIEVPNSDIAMVTLREVLEASHNQKEKLSFALGRDISGEAVFGQLNKMPHLLIAGATGSGKSVCINGIITSILMKAKPDEVKMMMIDPKQVELNVYNGIPHLLTPVVTDPNKASMALKKVVAEMERRYKLFSETATRNMESYNDYVKKQNELTDEAEPELPYIVVLVDELADLMMVASNDVEDSITRLAQMARAAGIHLIIATQRPSVDVITGVIKANIPSRIAFSVSSQVDSRTILDIGGAEKLLGRGDMLYIPVGKSKPLRVQGAFLSEEEVERIVDHCMKQQEVAYQEDMIPNDEPDKSVDVDDELFDDAVQLVVDMQSASVSMLQRRFRIGYNRAARLIDAMEERGIVGAYEGTRPRTVLISKQEENSS